MIRRGYLSLSLLAYLCIAIFSIHALTDDIPSPDGTSASCVLDFKEFPYQPTGECIGQQERIKDWNSFSTTLCCRDVLNVLTKLLAWRASNTSGDVFLPEDQWENCSGGFTRQNHISAYSCGFDKLYNGSSACSSLSMSSIKEQTYYKKAVASCSDFSSSYDDECSNCIEAISEARDFQLRQLNVTNDDKEEKLVCGVAIIISVVAANLNNQSLMIDDFYRCFPALDEFNEGYMKIKYSVVKVVFAIFIAIIVLLLVFLLIKYVSKGKKKRPKPVPQSEEITTWSGLYRFSKAEIENAINHSKVRKSLGRGSAGKVYKGVLPSGQVVAIKHIHKSSSCDSFQREVEGLSRVRHPNLVCLFGCCIEGGERYLVYEYCAAGNLSQNLRRKDTVLTWERRVKILRDCALGLRYLHHFIDGCIVHRDIKLTNILLTENLEPKLSDFGLAKMLGMEESKVFTDVRGTMGYMDPEYMSNAKLTCASDIYSFGIVALQLLSGQKVIELDLDARDQLIRKAKDVSAGNRPLTDFEDPSLNRKVNSVDFEAILQMAVLCVAKSSKGRPTIDDVFEEIEKAWKNTQAVMKPNSEIGSSMSKTMEVIPV
ncbi:hypothetical protein SADUNF_Sadunf13G0044600 [Salix dunnii]|uniref:Protein kinase domain-containing protein n=1 Tax=Salix dunnii TaxID=1413687 RepID=A0A835JKP4_9ROSI|nr:hypothetical protein SADUNF_Sadunf13G0044600 [Salix dunnii]